MKTTKPPMQVFISLILITSMLSTGFVIPVFAQRSRPIVITFGQPNIWSLEQAHYLLARMHRQNLDLQTAPLGSLDPNAANASRIDILKTLLQAGVSFDQAVAVNNSMLRRDKEFNSDRRHQLLNNRSTLQSQSTQLARDISSLRTDKAKAATDGEKTQIQESIDAKTDEKAAVDSELTQTNDELKTLTSASGDFQSVTVPEFSTSTITGDLDKLISKVELVNPSLAATLRLDNHIQLQYELISKQLSLLRDEVGPGERLVFLELPQSINATQDRAEGKMAQAWWRIAGYTKVNRAWLLLKELQSLFEQIHEIEKHIKIVEAQQNWTAANEHNKTNLVNQLNSLCERKRQREIEQKTQQDQLDALNKKDPKATPQDYEVLCKQFQHDLEDVGKEIERIDDSIKKTREAILRIDNQEIRLRDERARLVQAFTSLSTKYNKLQVEQVRNEIRRTQNTADRLLQRGGTDTTDIVEDTLRLLNGEYDFSRAAYKDPKGFDRSKCVGLLDPKTELDKKQAVNCQPREFVSLEETRPLSLSAEQAAQDEQKEVKTSQLKMRSVRTIDIIPRQNAINVQDTKQRVARTGIFAAFSFLFGFAGKFTYERQREQAEQFLNQELFTSGFGKGEKDFGWSFYPFAGTKQLASGVRTTYAVAVIPDEAETLVLKARGCYFPRKDNQPLNYNVAGHPEWINNDNASNAKCNPDEQVFVLPVPGGTGDGADYYVTGVRYSAFQEPGSRMVVSIQGQNLPSQVGVFVNGVPLREAVGLGQLNIESILGDDKTKDNCAGPICGRFERIDANEIVLSFNLGPDFEGTPRIGLIGPGRSIVLNRLDLTVNGQEDTQLDSADAMFGSPPDSTLRRIADFKVAPTAPLSNKMRGVLTGSKFKSDDNIYINGSLVPRPNCRKDLCIVEFDPQETDYLTVTVLPSSGTEKVVSKTFLNPKNLSIISASVVNFEPKDGARPSILTVKLDGSGFREDLTVSVVKSEGPPDLPKKIVASAGQMFLKILDPEAAVHINVTDPSNNRVVSVIVIRPQPPPKEK